MKAEQLATLSKGCFFPYIPEDNSKLKLPCGKCPNCLHRRIEGWTFRINEHLMRAKSAYFITLTYDSSSENRIIDRTPNGYLSLSKRHLQNYFKRLRKFHGDSVRTPFNDRVKYVACGEYGTGGKRPHYHAIVFNASTNGIIQAWSKCTQKATRKTPALFRPLGIVDIQEVNTSRIRYIFKYIQKQRLTNWQKLHSRDDRVPEFQLISQGIGKQWLEDARNINKHLGNIEQPYITTQNGKIAIPRYYKNKLYTDEQKKQIAEYMETQFEELELTQEEHSQLLEYKNEKSRLMFKKAKRENNEI